jgi:hypothetical protein
LLVLSVGTSVVLRKSTTTAKGNDSNGPVRQADEAQRQRTRRQAIRWLRTVYIVRSSGKYWRLNYRFDGKLDEIGLCFSKVKWSYTQQKIGGGSSGSTTGGWDLAAKKCRA